MINKELIYSRRGTASVMQILFLVIGIVAVAWIIGSEIGVVSGDKQKIFKARKINNFIMLPGDHLWSPDESFFSKLNVGVKNE